MTRIGNIKKSFYLTLKQSNHIMSNQKSVFLQEKREEKINIDRSSNIDFGS